MNKLLPKAKIDIFTKDAQTLELVKTLVQDWRSARINFNVEQGSVQEAGVYYQSNPSPDLLIIQTDTIGESFTDGLGNLAEYCDPETACLIIGPVNDVPLYRQLVQMGISDYLVAPVSGEDLMTTIGDILLEKYGQQDTELIAVIGSKGGIGTTSLSQFLAEGLSGIGNQKTLVMEMASSWGALPIWLGYEPSTSVHEMAQAAEMNDAESLARMVIPISDTLSVVGIGAEELYEKSVAAEEYEKILNSIIAQYPYIVVDLSSAQHDVQQLLLQKASRVIITSEPTISSLRITRVLVNEVKKLRGEDASDIDIVVTRSGLNKDLEISAADIKAAVDMEPLWVMPWLPKVMAERDMHEKKLMEIDESKKLIHEFLHKLYPENFALPEESKTLLEMLGVKKSA